MKVNKLISLNFNVASQTTTSINVNFPVKSIHIKSCAFTDYGAPQTGTKIYASLVSDLTNWEPLAIVYLDSEYSSQQFCDVSFQPYKPFTVGGTYTFKLLAPAGTPHETNTNDYLTLILEFNGVDTEHH
jgi:hypothetical protein